MNKNYQFIDEIYAALEAEVHLLAFLDTRDDVVTEFMDLVQRWI